MVNHGSKDLTRDENKRSLKHVLKEADLPEFYYNLTEKEYIDLKELYKLNYKELAI